MKADLYTCHHGQSGKGGEDSRGPQAEGSTESDGDGDQAWPWGLPRGERGQVQAWSWGLRAERLVRVSSTPPALFAEPHGQILFLFYLGFKFQWSSLSAVKGTPLFSVGCVWPLGGQE